MERAFLVFDTVDAIPVDLDDQLIPARKLIDAIFASLEISKFDAVTAPEEWDSYGWYFDVRLGKATICTMIQASDHWLVMNWIDVGFVDKILGRKFDSELSISRAAVLDAIRKARSDQNLQWLTEDELRAKA